METDKLMSIALRVSFGGAFLILALAGIEKALNLIGLDILGFYPAQLLNWSVVLLTVVIVLLLRQIRDQLKTR